MAFLERVTQSVTVAVGAEDRSARQRQAQEHEGEAAERTLATGAYGNASRNSVRSAGVSRPLKVALRCERSRQTSTSSWTNGHGS